MKTIKQKIMRSFLWLIIALPIVVMALFNISMRIYSSKTAQRELRSIANSIESLVFQQLSSNVLDRLESGAQNAGENLATLRAALRVSKVSVNTEFILVNASGKTLFPQTFSDSFLTSALVEKARSALSSADEDEIVYFRLKSGRYCATYKTLEIGIRNRSVDLVFISNGNAAAGVIRAINLMLFIITAVATGVSAYIASRLSKSISHPISALSAKAGGTGNGALPDLPDDKSSFEMYELTSSLRGMSKRLADSERAQKAFLQNASHELRTPLMSISGYAEGLAKGVFPDTAKAAGIICDESRRLNTLVEELLTLSRIENNSYAGETQSLNLPNMVKEYVQRVEGYALKENKRLSLDIPSAELYAQINDELLSKAVVNILSNAVRYAKSEVKISVSPRGNNALITISDDGNGISEKDLPHVFDRFYKGKNGNFGLGLSIAKSAVELMSGTVRAYNGAPGAVFEISLPISKKEV